MWVVVPGKRGCQPVHAAPPPADGATHTYLIPDEHASTMETVGRDFPGGFEVVIPCLLDGNGMSDALDSVALGGRIVMYGCIGESSPVAAAAFRRAHICTLIWPACFPPRDRDLRIFRLL